MTPEVLWQVLDAANISYQKHVSLAPFLSMKAGGPAWAFCEIPSEAVLQRALAAAAKAKVPTLVVGGGANLWVRDGGFAGLAMQLTESFVHLDEVDEEHWYAGSALPLQRLLDRASKEAREKFLFLGGIPGTVGGAVAMNAGTDKGEMCSVVAAVDVILPSGEKRRLLPSDLNFRYRGSDLPDGAIIVGALLSHGPVAAQAEEFRQLLKQRSEKRRRTQPVQFPTSGSTFKNPPGDFAGRLVEAAGLKGLRIGGAEISEVHANFIVNPQRKASTADLMALVRMAQETVSQKFAICLNLEVRVVGEGHEEALCHASHNTQNNTSRCTSECPYRTACAEQP